MIFVDFLPHYDPGVESTSNRTEYHGYHPGVEAAGMYS
jgi:hypothetical protein